MSTVDALFRRLLGELADAGFERVGRRQLAARVGDGILQFVIAGKTRDGFTLDFAAQPLWVPEQHLVLQPGGSIACSSSPYGKQRGGAVVCQFAYLRSGPSVPGAVIEPGYLWRLDDRVVAPISKALKTRVLPWFDGARDAAGLLAVLEQERWASYHHQHFARATVLARLDRVADARVAIDDAITGYRGDVASRPAATWCVERIARCRELQAAIDAGAHQDLLRDWAATTLEKLEIPAPSVSAPERVEGSRAKT
jgi:hypothetical protein